MRRLIALLFFMVFVVSRNSAAKCLELGMFKRCVEIIYKDTISFGVYPNWHEHLYCEGDAQILDEAIKDGRVSIIIKNGIIEGKNCPDSNTHLVGNILESCHDVLGGDAVDYSFEIVPEDYCKRTFEEASTWVKEKAEILNQQFEQSLKDEDQEIYRKDLEDIFQEQVLDGKDISKYYEHPDIIVEVPFDKTSNNASNLDVVNGPIKFYEQRGVGFTLE